MISTCLSKLVGNRSRASSILVKLSLRPKKARPVGKGGFIFVLFSEEYLFLGGFLGCVLMTRILSADSGFTVSTVGFIVSFLDVDGGLVFGLTWEAPKKKFADGLLVVFAVEGIFETTSEGLVLLGLSVLVLCGFDVDDECFSGLAFVMDWWKVKILSSSSSSFCWVLLTNCKNGSFWSGFLVGFEAVRSGLVGLSTGFVGRCSGFKEGLWLGFTFEWFKSGLSVRLTGFSEGLYLAGILCWLWSLMLLEEERAILFGICVLLAASGLRSSILMAVEWDAEEMTVTDGMIGMQVPERDCFNSALQTHRPNRLGIKKSQCESPSHRRQWLSL